MDYLKTLIAIFLPLGFAPLVTKPTIKQTIKQKLSRDRFAKSAQEAKKPSSRSLKLTEDRAILILI